MINNPDIVNVPFGIGVFRKPLIVALNNIKNK